jgi:perosamine synthetase
MRVRKSTPPTAVPISRSDLFRGLTAVLGVNPGERVEKEVRDCFGGRHVFFLSSGKAALFLLLVALKDLKGRTKVIIPGYTCFSVPSAVRKAGLKIVLCDVKSDSLDFDYDQLENLAGEETLCIVATHLFGIRSNVERARKIADRKGIFVIEDSAQAFGIPGEDKKSAQGDAEFFSLGRGKNITCGSGGIIVTGSEEIAHALRRHYIPLKTESISASVKALIELLLMGIFVNPYLYWIPDGLPFLGIGETRYYENYPVNKINKVKYGLLSGWKENLRSTNVTRSKIGEAYKEALSLDRRYPIYSNALPYLRFPVYLKNAERKAYVCSEYRHLGISAMYPTSIGKVKEISDSVSIDSCPDSEKISKTLITLPTHHLVDEGLREKICSVVVDNLNIRP